MADRDDWERLDDLLQAALERPAEDRDRWLDEACGDDRALRAEMAELVQLAEGDGDESRAGRPLTELRTAVRVPEGTDEAKTLPPGHRLGRYEILGLLGSGGMGRVYRALDPALHREVAIKALAQAFRDDAASQRRFEREARVLATLSHPNIAAIFGFEVLEGTPYLILERVLGETLADRLRGGRLSLSEAVAIAVQVAEGLEEAHAKGVIHRDLKPSNVMLGPGGRVKLVDFGLAKAPALPSSQRAVPSEPTTVSGVVLGTAPYMSPEQVHGQEVDARTDVWSFGCLLYEMLVGRVAFQGRSAPAVLAAVLRDEPDWNALPADVPPALRRLLQRCLRKDLRDRLQHIGDVRLELTQLPEEPASPVRLPGTVSARMGRLTRALPWAVALLAVGFAVWWPWRMSSRAPAPAVVRLSLELPRGLDLPSGFAAPFAIAPSGTSVVLEGVQDGAQRLYVRSLDDLVLRPLLGTEGARQPFFSADGHWVGFFADRKLKKVPLAGGPILPLADIGGNPRGAVWASGTIVLSPSQTSGLVRVADEGGRPVPLTTVDTARGESSHRWPDLLPGGWVLFTVAFEDASYDEARLEAVSLDTGERRVVMTGAGFGRYVPDGQLLFVRAGRLYAVGFDPERLQTRGDARVVLEGVRYDPRNGGAHVAVSSAGALLYSPGLPVSAEQYLSWFDHEGRFTRLVDTPRVFRDPRLGPDGRRVAVVVGSAAESDLWRLDGSGTLSRLSFGLSPHRPTWTPDGTHITVGAEKDGRWRLLLIPAEGGGEPTVLLEGPHRLYPDAWTPDGRYLVFQEHAGDNGWDLRFVPVEPGGRAGGPPLPLAVTPFHEANAVLSADGRWVAYESDELDGVFQVYVRSFPDGGHKVRVSTSGARWPRWAGAGELYYWDTSHDRAIAAATHEVLGELLVKDIRPLWGADVQTPAAIARVAANPGASRFDAHPSGTRLLVLEKSGTELEPLLSRPVVVLGWAEAMRASKGGT